MRDELKQHPENFSGKDYDDTSFNFVPKAMEVLSSKGFDPVIISDDGSAATDSICQSLTLGVSMPLIPPFLQEIWKNSFERGWYTVSNDVPDKHRFLMELIRIRLLQIPQLKHLFGEDEEFLNGWLFKIMISHDPHYSYEKHKSPDTLQINCINALLADSIRVLNLSGEVQSDWYPGSNVNGDIFETYDVQIRGLNGQPMGDRRSFVLLSLIHHSVKLAFVKQYRLERLGVQIFAHNGDDGLIVLPRRLVPAYISWMNKLWGLNEMKTWIDTEIFSFNSQTYRVKGGKVSSIPKIRWNLIQRVDKYGEKIHDPTVWNSVSESLPEGLHESIFHHHFKNYWSKTLSNLCRGGNNYFLPHNVGGLGLNPYGIRFKISPRQYLAIKIADYHLLKGERPKFATRQSYVNSEEIKSRREHRVHILTFSHKSLSLLNADIRRPGAYKGIDDRKRLKTRTLPKGSLGGERFPYLHHWKLNEGFVNLGDLDEVLEEINFPLSTPF